MNQLISDFRSQDQGWLHTLTLSRLEHHHPISQQYEFAIPEVKTSCICECDANSDVCSARTYSFTHCTSSNTTQVSSTFFWIINSERLEEFIDYDLIKKFKAKSIWALTVVNTKFVEFRLDKMDSSFLRENEEGLMKFKNLPVRSQSKLPYKRWYEIIWTGWTVFDYKKKQLRNTQGYISCRV